MNNLPQNEEAHMEIKLVTAIIRRDRLEVVEERLKPLSVERFNTTRVKGYGEYRNYFSSDWMDEEVKLEIFTHAQHVESITSAIMEAAHTGVAGDGVVAVLPVEKLFLVRTRSHATDEDFWPGRSRERSKA
jgi:nitrogen regulatory protein P-II 1